jgi:Skp family chaperone for outer membrane proteins
MKDHDLKDRCREGRGPCECLPASVRMNYFYGQLISERDLLTDQAYFRGKLRHANRCLHGYGVICGMVATAVEPPEECRPDDSDKRKKLRQEIARDEEELKALKVALDEADTEAKRADFEKRIEAAEESREALRQDLDEFQKDRPDQEDGCAEAPPLNRVRVSCGAAIDCDGYDVILQTDRVVDVWTLLKASERDALSDGAPGTVYLSVCYEECDREPTRPLARDACATTTGCEMARIAEGARLTASLDKPREDERCELCCTCCGDPCILLATIELAKDEPIGEDDIDNNVRRRFGLYQDTVITGINWVNGATYSGDVADGIIGRKNGTGGLEIQFSRPIHVSTIIPGTVEIIRVTGKGGVAGIFAAMEGEFVGLPDDGLTDRIRYRNVSRETVQENDRILVIVRAPFLLDRCCRPVAGLHVGGRVPRLELDTEADKAARAEEEKAGLPNHAVCVHPPRGPMAWTTEGHGEFQSWFWIAREE